jgi:hypothetical protein
VGSLLAASEKRLKRGLKSRHRTVVLFSDATIINEIPPLRARWALKGMPAEVTHHRQLEQKGSIWDPHRQSRSHLPGLGPEVEPGELPGAPSAYQVPVGRLEGCAVPRPGLAPHRQGEPKAGQGAGHRPTLAANCLSGTEPGRGIWRHSKETGPANRPTLWMEELTNRVIRYIQSLSPVEPMRMAGVLIG